MENQNVEVADYQMTNVPDLVIITGMSGAGRTEAMHTFEDLGYFCIDNLPPSLLRDLVTLAGDNDGSRRRLAVVCDLRARAFFQEFVSELDKVKSEGVTFSLLFLDSDDESLLKRFKASRRRHPLCEKGMTIMDGIEKERAQLKKVKKLADYVIDTSKLRSQGLRDKIHELFGENNPEDALQARVYSFGFKYGQPADADIMMDVRFLPNPYYEEDLRYHTGLDEGVRSYVLENGETKLFLERWHALLDVVMPGYVSEGKKYIVIALGCTGGQHRSVALAQETFEYLNAQGYSVTVEHRDISNAEVK